MTALSLNFEHVPEIIKLLPIRIFAFHDCSVVAVIGFFSDGVGICLLNLKVQLN